MISGGEASLKIMRLEGPSDFNFIYAVVNYFIDIYKWLEENKYLKIIYQETGSKENMDQEFGDCEQKK